MEQELVRFSWTVHEVMTLKTFLKQQGISRRMLVRIKYHGGGIWVNEEEQTVKHWVKIGDTVTVLLPPEGKQPQIPAVQGKVQILFEDEHYLVINKPAGLTSIPAQFDETISMANIVKFYYEQQGYVNQVIHVVTRLDRNTSGAMLFAKHKYAHGAIDRMMRTNGIEKFYLAFTDAPVLFGAHHGILDAPIERKEGSIIERCVREDGKAAQTEFWLEECKNGVYRYKVQLHTGRTHQIRVHFAYFGAPLIGDNLYGGRQIVAFDRQALHCERLHFVHPFSHSEVNIEAPLPAEIENWYQNGEVKAIR